MRQEIHPMTFHRSLALVPLALVSACAVEGDAPASARDPVYGGAAPNQPYHAAVVALHERTSRGVSSSPFCTGTFIGGQWILTAAHCSVDRRNRAKSASSFAVYVGDNPRLDLAAHVYLVDRVIVHPSYSGTTLRNDIALLRVTRAITESAPVPHLPGTLALGPADIGASLNHAGFGYNEQRLFGVKLQADVPIGGYGCSVSGCPSPGDAATQISYSQRANALYPLGLGPCNGDSGGPAFVLRGGVPYVAGITSYGDANCNVYGVSTKVDAFDAWIRTQTGL
jgi:secreted trypsin-like serine protease